MLAKAADAYCISADSRESAFERSLRPADGLDAGHPETPARRGRFRIAEFCQLFAAFLGDGQHLGHRQRSCRGVVG